LVNVLVLVDNLLEEVLGTNPHLDVLVGDVLSFVITTTPAAPFLVSASQNGGQVYPGFSAAQGYVSGPIPTLTIGQDIAGQTLYYGCPGRQGFFGLIRVGVLGSGGLLGNLLNALLGNHGLLGGGLLGNHGVLGGVLAGGSSGLLGGVLGGGSNGLLGGVGGLLGGASQKRDLLSGLLSGVQHTYIIDGAYPVWNFLGSVIGNILGTVLGQNPIIYVNVGDVITLRVTTTPQHPFAVCVSLVGGTCSVYAGFSHPAGYISGPYPTLTIRSGIRVLFYVSLRDPTVMAGVIRVN
jgi:hypothetical protein